MDSLSSFFHSRSSSATEHPPASNPQARPPAAMMPQMQGDPTFLYGGYGYRPPTFGYAWLGGASQPTSFCQLPPASRVPSTSSPKALSKSVSAPDLQNTAAVQQMQPKSTPQTQQMQPQHHHAKTMHGTPPLPHHKKMGHLSSHLPGTPEGVSAANTPSSSRASTPPRRTSAIRDDSFYIGMAAA